MPARRAVIAVVLACLPAAACGAERVAAPSTVVGPDAPLERERFARVGLTLSLPTALELERDRPGPSVFRATYADWYVAAFAYRRSEQLPRRRSELGAARRRLVRQVRRRNERFRVVRSRSTRVGGAPAVEIIGDQTVARSRLRTRSLHIYKGRAEYVLELVAPVRSFAELQRNAFDRIVNSVRVTGKVERRRREREGDR